MDETTTGEQLDLLDVGPENLKEIVPVARAYKKIMTQRVSMLAEEVDLKEKIKSFVHKSGLKRLPDGSFKFKCEGVTVKVIPGEEKVNVKENEDKGE